MGVTQYLSRYAEASSRHVRDVPGSYRRALVVPARAEPPGFVQPLLAAAGSDVLVIVVLNARPGEASCNAELRAALGTGLVRERDGVTTVVLDEVTDGVGHARKCGFDLALALWAERRLAEPWIHSTDADAIPSGLDANPADAVAMSLPLWHEPGGDARVDEATALYELWLRYYVAGLAWAGSPWAFLTVGSALAVQAEAYAAVRGMPKRAAGEDFYLLAKLAKLGRIVTPNVPPVRIRARLSDRVPFGTGPGVARIVADLAQGIPPTFYAPEVFAELRDILGAVDRGNVPASPAWSALGGRQGLEAAVQSARTAEQRRRRTREWLDAFRTLKLVHLLERSHPRIPWADAVAKAPFCPTDTDVDALRRAL